MKRLLFTLAIILGSCSSDSMDISEPSPPKTYYIQVVQRTECIELRYSDATKTKVIQKRDLPSNSGTRVIYQKTGATYDEMQSIRQRYTGVSEVEITDQGTVINYEWRYSYEVKVNTL